MGAGPAFEGGGNGGLIRFMDLGDARSPRVFGKLEIEGDWDAVAFHRHCVWRDRIAIAVDHQARISLPYEDCIQQHGQPLSQCIDTDIPSDMTR